MTYDGELDYAFPPQSVTLTLEDEIDVSRGEMLVHPDNLPVVGRNFEAMLVWMDEEPMDMNKSFFIKQTTHTSRSHVDSIKYKVDVNTMEITNNTSAVGMIIGPVPEEEMHADAGLPVLDLPKLGIAPEHYEAIDRAVKELERQGLEIVVRK